MRATTACARSAPTLATTTSACASASANRTSRSLCPHTCLEISQKANGGGAGAEALCDVIADNAPLLIEGKDSSFQNKVHLAMEAKGFNGRDDEPPPTK